MPRLARPQTGKRTRRCLSAPTGPPVTTSSRTKLRHLDVAISCLICGQPLPSREDRHVFKYFLMAGPGRPRIARRARDTVEQLSELRCLAGVAVGLGGIEDPIFLANNVRLVGIA